YGLISTLTIDAGSGGNEMALWSTHPGSSTILVGGTGNDVFHVGAGSVDLIRSPVMVVGGGGGDQLFLDDTDNLNGQKLTITPVQVGVGNDTFYGANGSLVYTGLSGLTVEMGRGNDIVVVAGQATGTSTYINTQGGDDTITVNVTPTSGYNGLTIDGGADHD